MLDRALCEFAHVCAALRHMNRQICLTNPHLGCRPILMAIPAIWTMATKTSPGLDATLETAMTTMMMSYCRLLAAPTIHRYPPASQRHALSCLPACSGCRQQQAILVPPRASLFLDTPASWCSSPAVLCLRWTPPVFI